MVITPERSEGEGGKCAERVVVFEDGRRAAELCPDEARARAMTVIDLADDWTPVLFSEDAALGERGAPPYRSTFVALANEKWGDGPEWDRARSDRYLELYGIFPSLAVVRTRLADDARHRCHEAVSDAALVELDQVIEPWRDLAAQRSDKGFARTLRAKLEAERKRRDLESIEQLADDPYFKATWGHHQRVGKRVEAIVAAQEHLRCEGLLSDKAERGVFDYGSTQALRAFQRKHMIVSWRLDAETQAALVADSHELDFRAALRVLRERIVDATGMLEDGSARAESGQVVGRMLDAEAFRSAEGRGALENGAPDRIAAATDAAARALGWTSPEALRAFFDGAGPEGTAHLHVAVKLPAPPRYLGKDMALRAEIDRGDVWYEPPFGRTGDVQSHPVARRPTLTLYAKDGDREVALMRWPTTIGGWKPERLGPRRMAMVYKESPEGPRVWRDVIVAPVWIPPDSAPKRDLVRPRPGGGWAVNQDVFGPGYASAYGLVMLVHHRVAKIKNDKDPLKDEGIRTHGSVSYDSIHQGSSHGCHRLHNHMALRLGAFLVSHRHTERHGAIELGYGRRFAWEGKEMRLSFDSRGYRFELDPPVQVDVLRGRVMGSQLAPSQDSRPLPDKLAARFKQEQFED
ncbi:MAG: L,D-transpeptidase family protein [Polyangiaceae bacterium]